MRERSSHWAYNPAKRRAAAAPGGISEAHMVRRQADRASLTASRTVHVDSVCHRALIEVISLVRGMREGPGRNESICGQERLCDKDVEGVLQSSQRYRRQYAPAAWQGMCTKSIYIQLPDTAVTPRVPAIVLPHLDRPHHRHVM